MNDKIEVRTHYDLSDILKYDNCHISHLTYFKMRRLIAASDDGNTFCVHTHRGATPAVRYYMRRGKVKATYIFRDPRDVVLSAYQHGIRERKSGLRWRNFAKLRTIKLAILWVMFRQIPRYRSWKRQDRELVHFARYEDLVRDTRGEMERLARFLGLEVSDEKIDEIIRRYDREGLKEKKVDSFHFYKGQIGRFREELASEELVLCNRLFRRVLLEMGYEV